MSDDHRDEFLELYRKHHLLLTSGQVDEVALDRAILEFHLVDESLAQLMGALAGYPAEALRARAADVRGDSGGYWDTTWTGTVEELYDAAAAAGENRQRG